MNAIEGFLHDLDRAWDLENSTKIRLPIFGSAALLLQTSYQRMTKDSDVLETSQHTDAVKKRLHRLAGQGSDLHRQHRLYVEIVPNGIPFLPHVPDWRPFALDLKWFEVEVLGIVDVVVSKLARFSANDRSDIDAMISGGHVAHARFVERFRAAVDERIGDAREDQLPSIIDRFHTVERDMFDVAETEIELPSWI